MEIKLMIGLGNPGSEYENTYHNVGHLFVNHLAGEKARFKKENYFEYLKRPPLVLAKTATFMNQSGASLAAVKKYFALKPGEILVAHDDADIPLGSWKISFGRGSAGHQGIESAIRTLRTKNFHRLRIGIRPQRERARKKANEFVLGKIGAREKKVLEELFRELQVNSKSHFAAGLRRNA